MSETITPDPVTEAPKPKRRTANGGASVADVFGGGLGNLHTSPAQVASGPGRPQELALDAIDEDPEQPRTSFDPEALAELAATIKERGVKTPISVRPHPSEAGRFMINHGARRFRASRLAGRTTIPAFIDTDHSAADQVIENLQRDNLTPREIADYIGREIAAGRKKGDIAKAIGKSASYVTQHVALLDLPAPINAAWEAGKIGDVTIVAELLRLFKTDESAVIEHLATNDEITRSGVRMLKEYIEARRRPAPPEEGKSDGEEAEPEPKAAKAIKYAAYVELRHDGKLGTLILNQRPSEPGRGWIKYDDGRKAEIDLAEAQIVAVSEA